jgi:mycothiol synthase
MTVSPDPYQQLHMVWPEGLLGSPPVPRLPEGYELRPYTSADAEAYLDLMARAGFQSWDPEQLQKTLTSVLPGGFLVVVHRATGRLVATAMARHRPSELHPGGGELSWVAADPDHRGHGLGLAVCAAVVDRLLQAGYRRIFLLTDDFRLPAIRVYRRLGFEPFPFCPAVAERWRRLADQLC